MWPHISIQNYRSMTIRLKFKYITCALCEKKKEYLVRRIAHKRVIRLSIRGFTAPAGSLGKAKKPNVACQIK